MNERFRQQVEWDVAWRQAGRCGRRCDPDQRGCSHYLALLAVRRDLHDQIGSTLAGIAMQLELACRLADIDASRVRDVLWEMRADVTELVTSVRRIGDGHGSDHRVVDMEAALRSIVDRLNRAAAPRHEISLEFDPAVSSVCEETGSAAFWIVREAVMNMLKHSLAQHCRVSLRVHDDELLVRVEDDGCPSLRPPTAGPNSGLANMSARAAELGGWCTAGPLEPSGFAVVACLPVTSVRG